MGEAPVAYLADSVLLIDHFNGIAAATEFLFAHLDEIALSVIGRAEIRIGLEGDESPAAETARAFLDRLPTLPIDRETADTAASLRKRHGWKLPDALQAAVALRHGLKLVTRDVKEFPPEDFEFVVVPYTLA